ncbi:hypothetical protein CSW60_22030 [Caulobacter sp. X]|nr:hypothetical protein CSW60_22030 [Caulobacter sp. X]
MSHMTVSRALNDHPNVSANVRERVLKLATEAGYVQSASAKSLRGLKSGAVGLLLPNIVNEFYAQFAQAFGDLCAQQRLNLVIHLTGEDEDRERQALTQLRGLHADTAIIVPTVRGHYGLAGPIGSGMRLLFLTRTPSDAPPAAAVEIDDQGAIAQAVSHLANAGHQEIAFIGPTTALSTGRSRHDAFLRAMHAASLATPPERVIAGPPVYGHGRDAVRTLLASQARPTAILCGGVEITRGAIEQLLEANIALGDDLAFVGYGDPTIYSWLCGGVSSIALPIDALARSAFDLATAVSPPPAQRMTHDARLVVRRSSRAINRP